MGQRCYERFTELQAEREATQIQLDALDRATTPGNDTALLDLIPLLTDTIALHPEHIQAALYQAFDIQALYKDDMNQVTLFATITTSTPQAVAAAILARRTSATTPPPPQHPPAASPRHHRPCFTLWRKTFTYLASSTRIKKIALRPAAVRALQSGYASGADGARCSSRRWQQHAALLRWQPRSYLLDMAIALSRAISPVWSSSPPLAGPTQGGLGFVSAAAGLPMWGGRPELPAVLRRCTRLSHARPPAHLRASATRDRRGFRTRSTCGSTRTSGLACGCCRLVTKHVSLFSEP